MKISEIRQALRESGMNFEAVVAPDVIIHFKVDPARLTASMFEFISQSGSEIEQIGLEEYICTAFSLISWWDLEDENGVEYERTPEALVQLEYPIKWAVLQALPRAFAPNFQT